MKLQFLTFSDLLLGLGDLIETRLPKVTKAHSIALYLPRLRAQLKAIEVLPGATTSGEPFAQELADTDGQHDGHGAAIYYLVEAHLRSPTVDDATKATLRAARDRIVPELAELKASFPDEAAKAVLHESDVEALKGSLKKVPVAGAHSLYDWCVSFIGAGKELDKLLRKRADVVTGDRSGAGALRASSVGLLNRFRSALADELTDDAEALATTDHALFAYLDALEARRASATPAATPETPAVAAPATPA